MTELTRTIYEVDYLLDRINAATKCRVCGDLDADEYAGLGYYCSDECCTVGRQWMEPGPP